MWHDAFAANDPSEGSAQILMEDTPPCEKFNCPLAEKCKSQVLACKAFAEHVAHGDKVYDNASFTARMVNPTRKVYLKIFPDTENDFHLASA